MAEKLTTDDFVPLSMYDTFNKKNLLKNQIDAFDNFYDTIPPLIYKHYPQNKVINIDSHNASGISKMGFGFSFENIRYIKKYTTTDDKKTKPYYPNLCILNKTTYAVNIVADINTYQYKVGKNGNILDRQDDKILNITLGSIPQVVGSKFCHLKDLDDITKKNIGEDPEDYGGYFIINGSKKSVIATKNVIKNAPQFYIKNKENVLVRADIISQNGDSFETSRYMITQMHNNKGITIKITIGKGVDLILPFTLVYRIFNITTDKGIFDTILPNYDTDNEMENKIALLIREAFLFDYLSLAKDEKHSYIRLFYENDKLLDNTAELIFRLAKAINMINTGVTADKFEIENVKKKNKQEKKNIINDVLAKLDTLILPHIGLDENSRIEKLKYLGSMIKGIYGVYLGNPPSDRNSFCNQVINNTLLVMIISFKTIFNVTIVAKILNDLIKNFSSGTSINLLKVIPPLIKSDDLGTSLCKAIKAGNKATIKINKNPTTNRVITQQLDTTNQCAIFNSLRIIQNTKTIGGKTNDAVLKSRNIHPTSAGCICPIQSAEGERAGLIASLTLGCEITDIIYTKEIEDYLEKLEILNLDIINTNEGKNYSLIILNGKPIGSYHDTKQLANEMRLIRRSGLIHRHTTILFKPLVGGQLEINTQKGRTIRPLVIVYNNEKDFISGKDKEFKQWIKYTSQHGKDLLAGKITKEDLINDQIIEMISPLEYTNIYVASSYEQFEQHQNNILYPYTHVDLPHSNIGINALGAPFANHSDIVRVTYLANQLKQSLGLPTLNYADSFINKFYVPLNNYLPLTGTLFNNIMRSNGAPVFVAILSDGNNQEDSLCLNETMVVRGKFDIIYYSIISVEAESGQTFNTPTKGSTTDLKASSYSHLINGIPMKGTVITKGMPIIGRLEKKPDGGYKDQSVIYKKKKPIIIDNVISTSNSTGRKIMIIKGHSLRPVESGDKFSARSGGKSIISDILYEEKIPITKNGIRPDVILNPHAFPSRMIPNQIMEGIYTKYCNFIGKRCDISIFKACLPEIIMKMIQEMGESDEEEFYNDITGKKYMGKIYMCPMFYQRLIKMIQDSSSAVDKPTLDIRTQQRVKGINNNGGSRFGNMEIICAMVIGSMGMIEAKLFKDSDGKLAHVCNNCGQYGYINPNEKLYACKNCRNTTFSELSTTFATFQFIKILNIIGINIKLKTSKPELLVQME